MNKTLKAEMKSVREDARGVANGATRSGKRVTRVWIVDDNSALRVLFSQLLNKDQALKCSRQFADTDGMLAALAEEKPPDMILLDMYLGGRNSLEAIRPALKLAPSVRVMMMTMFSNSYYEAEAFRAGAAGFLLKSYEPEEIVKAIHEANQFPGSMALFPNLALQTMVRQEATSSSCEGDGVRKFSLKRMLREIYRSRVPQTA
jgi:DNA-binding NarL/FixJ family response regulator